MLSESMIKETGGTGEYPSGRHGPIAGRKAAQDSKRAAMFTKYGRQIIVAAKAGGDPEYNATLRVAMKRRKPSVCRMIILREQ